MTKLSSLINTWRKCNLTTPPYLFPGDNIEQFQGMYSNFSSFDEYIAHPDFDKPDDTRLHLGLYPLPYIGDLSNASIYILMLNPGFSPNGYHVEHQYPDYRALLQRNLFQEAAGDKYPFFCLNPKLSWTGGYEYWAKKLSSIIQETKKRMKLSQQEVLSFLSKKLAVLELLPYFSRKFGGENLINKLPSAQLMKQYVTDELVPKARNGKALIVVTRGNKHWDIREDANIIVYNAWEALGAYLTIKSRGGEAIVQHLARINGE